MSRPFKFRIWDEKVGGFDYFDLFSSFGHVPLDIRENVQEFTGAEDTLGGEIYVGDIVSVQNNIRRRYEHGEVIYSPEYLAYFVKFYTKSDYYSEYLSHLRNVHVRMIVIGNVFQNKELLSQ